MTESARTTSIPTESFASSAHSQPRVGLVAQYRLDHRNPVNHFLHVGVGWPLVAFSIFLLPFRPLYSAALFLSGYAIMFFGHFVFERNAPTILTQPSTPFVMAYAVIRDLWAGLVRLARPRRVR
jgi:hypothetical protein